MKQADGPFVAAAFICERVLREVDGVLSAMRIIDRVTIKAPKETVDVVAA